MTARGRLGTSLATCVLLAWAAPSPSAALEALGRGDLGLALAAVCGLLALALVAVLAFGALLVLLAQLPGPAGRAAVAASRRCLPAALRSVLVAALSFGAVGAPVVAGVASADTKRPRVASELPDLDRPADPTAGAPLQVETPQGAPVQEGRGPATVVVRPGDSLWQITARALGTSAGARDIAVAWPRWWAANRTVIGPDPDLIHPGQHLSAPTQ